MVILDFFVFVFVFSGIIISKKTCKELMQWGKLQGVQEPDRSKIVLKKEKQLLFGRSVKSVIVKLLLLKSLIPNGNDLTQCQYKKNLPASRAHSHRALRAQV